ncbi:hypothetical protein [Deminuibacter soli]|uniref:hypothetical protein n=1 Tax=Deminuibacter soli TaxID=2291815 RepID=UPI001314F5D3|nr:hypothetical protein [Deminuibacter soli]
MVYEYATPTDLSTTAINAYWFKYVLIAGSLRQSMEKDRVNVNDYTAVERYVSTHSGK